MAKLLKRHWATDAGAGLPRQDRRSCDYTAYLPDPLAGRDIVLEGSVVADVSDAETALVRFSQGAGVLADSEALARLLLRTEAVASSRIEGLEIGARRLLRADAARGLGEPTRDVTAADVLGNIDAMVYATQSVGPDDDVSVDLLLEIHRRLLAGTRLESHGGRFRREQNWIGGSSFNPCSAEFVPPPPEYVRELASDLCHFCNDASLSPLVQAAMAHAQFETIHPFVDGNGRVGRALVHVVLRRRGLVTRAAPPVSLILATWADEYVRALTETRYVGSADSVATKQSTTRWIALFAAAMSRAVADADAFEEHVRGLERTWRERLGGPRAGSAADLLLSQLPGAPIVTVKSAAALIGRSAQATNEAVARLADAKVLKQTSVGRRNRAFEAPEVIRAFTDLERRLASPTGDTRVSPPRRPTPRR